jgi:hypothetical protein
LNVLNAPWFCAATFAVLKLLADTYQAFYYGVALHPSSTLLGAFIVSVAGTMGYLSGTWMLGKQLPMRAVFFVSFLSYFVAYSVSRLLASVTTSPLLFIAGLFVITFLITVRLGPRWEQS